MFNSTDSIMLATRFNLTCKKCWSQHACIHGLMAFKFAIYYQLPGRKNKEKRLDTWTTMKMRWWWTSRMFKVIKIGSSIQFSTKEGASWWRYCQCFCYIIWWLWLEGESNCIFNIVAKIFAYILTYIT